MLRLIGPVILVLLVSGLSGVAAEGAPVDFTGCDESDPICPLPEECDATRPGQLTADPVGVILECAT